MQHVIGWHSALKLIIAEYTHPWQSLLPYQSAFSHGNGAYLFFPNKDYGNLLLSH